MAKQPCVIVYFNDDATEADFIAFQEAVDHVDCDLDGVVDYSVQGYSDGFGNVVSKKETVRTH